jgi:hypothetical protein
MQGEENPVSKSRKIAGKALLYFCVFGMIASSAIKFLQPPNAVAYLGALGYEHGTYFLIAALELLCGVIFMFKSTRSLGLLLVSAYFGGAISAHWASHPSVTGGPFLTFMLNHPFIGSFDPGIFLFSAWIGTWLCRPELFWAWEKSSERKELSRQERAETVVLSRS